MIDLLFSSPLPPQLPAPLVLASTSRYRQAQLARLGVPFTCVAPDYGEPPVPGVAAADLPLRHAIEKVRAVARARNDGAWILGADQGVVLGTGPQSVLLGKPHTAERAVDQLLSLAGGPHLLRTGVALWRPSAPVATRVVDVTLWMRPLSRVQAEAYVNADQPLDCAGSYRIESRGPWIFARAHGDDPTAIEGLPLLAVTDLLLCALAECGRQAAG
ncbi:MAG: Maf-like protein [Deltaproteobacteria bacterium]|nr:Maf-like protein [Deltaproteobacteria bacterium]